MIPVSEGTRLPIAQTHPNRRAVTVTWYGGRGLTEVIYYDVVDVFPLYKLLIYKYMNLNGRNINNKNKSNNFF